MNSKVVVALVVLTTITACVKRTALNPFSRGSDEPSTVQIYVDNQNFNDLTLLAITTRGRQPLGRIGGATRRTFTLPWQGLDELRIRIEVLAGQDYESNRLNVSPGDRLELTVPRDPRNAYLRPRGR